ncbi:MAG: hypothetical protein HOP07_14095 [Bacteriovoracaceae bacterium]|nr:hypothetical protein [Bacteriovoracaceae bacterium]
MQDSLPSQEFIPTNENARIAVERARRTVKYNNEMIAELKAQSNLQSSSEADEAFKNAENFSFDGPYAFHRTKIKSSSGLKDFLSDVFGVH